MKNMHFLTFVYLFAIVGLFLYSYTQVDLSLTLSRFSIWQIIEKGFQYVGYFMRPVSTVLYISLLVLLFGIFLCFVQAAKNKKLSEKTVWFLIGMTALILTFSYNAFSYDMFNYIFYPKIILHYHLNPYLYKPLDFPNDPMLSFMHWTQNTYPYGPVWLLLTIPFSFVGGKVFLLTFFLFKLIATLSYVGTAYFIQKIMQKFSPESAVSALVLFAFQPLVLIETLVSAHNDITMIFFLTMSLYLLMSRKYVWSFFVFIVSVGVKFATAIAFPLFIWTFFLQRGKKQIDYEKIFLAGVFLSFIPIILATLRTNFQPWYFLYVLPFVALLPKKYYITIPYIVFSFFALLQYVPFLYTGNWNPPIPLILNELSLIGVALSLVSVSSIFLYKFFVAKK